MLVRDDHVGEHSLLPLAKMSPWRSHSVASPRMNRNRTDNSRWWSDLECLGAIWLGVRDGIRNWVTGA